MNALYTFHREGMFYPLELPGMDNIIIHAKCNPGTEKIIRHFPTPEEVVYDAEEYQPDNPNRDSGMNCFCNGWARIDNPHRELSKWWHEWDEGWIEGNGGKP